VSRILRFHCSHLMYHSNNDIIAVRISEINLLTTEIRRNYVNIRLLHYRAHCLRIKRNAYKQHANKLGYNVIKGTEYFVSFKTTVVITEEYDVMFNSEEVTVTTECVTQ
jgi:hypothetical protein